jgi:mono/diheme cytochrome c family protein
MKNLNRMLSMDKTKLKRALGIALASSALFVAATAIADEGVEAAGKARFMESCAVCHGEDAKGKGPFASLLTTPPPDLTVLTKNAGGEFPFNKIFDSIDGRAATGAHGTKDMPIWGSEWKGTSVATETALRGRILEMIIYLRSVQE